MAKKQHTEEQELPFVALMDTMTNVVGVLTIVLVMVGITLARSASKVISELPPVTPEEFQALAAKLASARADQAAELAKLKELPELTPEQLAALDAELARLERELPPDIQVVDFEALARELTQREGELKQKKSEADARMAELDALKTRLDKTPVQKAVASGKTVRLPVSRPIPENARIERMLATRDGIYWLDSEGAKSAFLKEFKSSAIREMKKERVKRDKETITVYDHALLTRHFEKRKLVHGDFQLNLLFAPWTPCPILEMAPRGKPSGTAVSAVLRRVEEVSRAVVMLHVTADGIENYLALRERFDRLDVPAGWTFVGAPEYRFVVSDIQTNYPVEPPKPPPPSATPPAPGTVIRPPTPKLD